MYQWLRARIPAGRSCWPAIPRVVTLARAAAAAVRRRETGGNSGHLRCSRPRGPRATSGPTRCFRRGHSMPWRHGSGRPPPRTWSTAGPKTSASRSTISNPACRRHPYSRSARSAARRAAGRRQAGGGAGAPKPRYGFWPVRSFFQLATPLVPEATRSLRQIG